MQQVHLRINDAATGHPTAVRLRVTDAAGREFAPFGIPLEFPTHSGEDVGGRLLIHGQRWFYVNGACEILLPPGMITVEASKGPEYQPLHETTQLIAGKLALRFSIERWTDMRAKGWYSGDTRSHELSPHDALLEAAAEDLAVANLLIRESGFVDRDGNRFTIVKNLSAFSGQRACLDSAATAFKSVTQATESAGGSHRHMVAINSMNVHPVLGTLALLNCHRVVYPLSFGGEHQSDDWSLSDWCGQCHRKKGLVVWVGLDSNRDYLGEALANLILGEIDAIEITDSQPSQFETWYSLLNVGCRAPICGASGKSDNVTALGNLRTYAQLLGQPLTYVNWIEAVRAGRTFVTTGPMIELTVNDDQTRVVHRLDQGKTKVTVRYASPNAEAELLYNGQVVARGHAEEIEFDAAEGGWLAARCRNEGRIVAHTSPQYIEVEGRCAPVDPQAVKLLQAHLQKTRDWIVNRGRFDKESSRDHLLGIIDGARNRLPMA